MKNIVISFLLVGLFLLFLGLATNRIVSKSPEAQRKLKLERKEIIVDQIHLKVEVANTEETRAVGLSQTERLGETEGMIFVFNNLNVTPTFWMKDMKFAIDIIWIDEGKIVKIDSNVPPPHPGATDPELKLYRYEKPIDYVLEAKGGFTERNGVKVGDDVDITKILTKK